MNKLKDSLGLVGPRSMSNMKAWRNSQKSRASSLTAAAASMETHEYIVPVNEKKKAKEVINLDDALLE
jgi:hypothetical protein